MPLELFTALALSMLPQQPGGPFLSGAVEHEGRSYPYRLLPPAEVEPGRRYPLILFLHGAGERGEDNLLQLRHFPERMVEPEQRERFPAFLLAPQCPEEADWADGGRGLALGGPWTAAPRPALRAALLALEEVVREHPVDRDALHLTGLSMGGAGTWDLAARCPDLFASAVAICGGGDALQAPRLLGLPMQAWHGLADTVVPPSATGEMVEAVRVCGGEVTWFELEGVGHDSWVAAYGPEATPSWMLGQRRAPQRIFQRTLEELAAALESRGPLTLLAGDEGASAALVRELESRRPGCVRTLEWSGEVGELDGRLSLVVPPAEVDTEALTERLERFGDAGARVLVACVPGGAGRAMVRAAAQRSGARLVDPSAAVEAYLRIFGARAGVEDPAEQARSEEESRRVTLLELARAVLVSLRAEELSRSAEAGR